MWDRVLLKEKGKHAFRSNYWHCVLVAFILMLFVGGNAGSGRVERNDSSYNDSSVQIITPWNYGISSNSAVKSAQNAFLEWTADYVFFSPAKALIVSTITLMVAIVMITLSIFVFSPLEVGGCRFFIENSYQPALAGRLLYPFKCGHYGKIVTAMFLRDLYIFGWTLLLVIPGIVKSYEYRMVPYLMAECPEMGQAEAFRISRELMYGQKMNTFILDLSFIGWGILSTCTFGILGIFYVNPYQQATNAELFLELKRQYFANQNQYGGGMQY